MRSFLVTLLILGSGYLAVRKATIWHGTFVPVTAQEAALRELANEAMASGDVPVAAILLYDGEIIGRGFNTVLRDRDAGGHAEVNAVSDAMERVGRDRLRALDRDRLLLVSTFEPCAMCSGMMLEYGIERVAFIEPKGIGHWLVQDVRWTLQQLRKQRSTPEGLQDSLFRAHPNYDPERADH